MKIYGTVLPMYILDLFFKPKHVNDLICRKKDYEENVNKNVRLFYCLTYLLIYLLIFIQQMLLKSTLNLRNSI